MQTTNPCQVSETAAGKTFFLRPGQASDQAPMIQQVVDECSAQGGGTVVLQAGLYRSGTVVLRSGVNLHLERGATLLASANLADYFHKDGDATALIFAEGARDIALTGEGTVDGNFPAFCVGRTEGIGWIEASKTTGTWIPGFGVKMRPRPLALVLLADCRDVRMETVCVQNSPRWTVHLLGCTDVVIRGVRVRNPIEVPNGDGFDLDGCSQVLMEDCDIVTSDDAIALKATRTFGLARPCRDITIRRCRAGTTCHGFCIGHETQDDFENILVSDLRIFGWGGQRATTGIGLGMIDGAAIRGVRLSGIQMNHVVAPLHVRVSDEGRTYRGQTAYRREGQASNYIDIKNGQRPPGKLEDVVLEDVSIADATGVSFLSGLPGHPLRRVRLRNLRLQLTESVDPARILTAVPELVWEYPKAEFWRFLPSYGLFCRHIDGLDLVDVAITAAAGEPRPALLLKDVGSCSCRSFHATERE